MVRVRFEMEKARPILANMLGYGLGKFVTREYQIRFGRRLAGAGEFGGLVITAAGAAVQFLEDIPYESDVKQIAGVAGLAGLDDLVDVYVYDEPIAWFTDANTLVIRNLGAFSSAPADWSVIVDGSPVSVSSVEGDTGKATLHLATAVAKGKHDVIVSVKGGRKAFSGKLYVP